MATLFIFIILLMVSCLIVLRWIKTGWVLLIIGLIGFYFIGNGFVPSLLLNSLEQAYVTDEQKWDKRNAIILLGAGTVRIPHADEVKPTLLAYSRILETADAYFSCKKLHRQCHIIVSGGDPQQHGISEAAVYRRELLDLHVDAADVQVEPHSKNTYQNAQFTSTLLKRQSFDRVYLVTSALHMKRALLYFNYFDVKATPIAADYVTASVGLMPSGYDFVMTDFALNEYVGIARLYVYDYLGWNKK